MTESTAAQVAREFFRSSGVGILSTQSVDVEGYPFGSVTPYAVTSEGRPIILISTIAQHTKNIGGDARVCMTVMDNASADKQAGARVSLIGDAQRIDEQSNAKELQDHYLTFYPAHAAYFKTHGFLFYQIDPVRIRYIGGFGKIHWIERDDWLAASSS